MRLRSEKWPKNLVWTHVRGGPAFALHKDMTFAGARCPSCHSLHIDSDVPHLVRDVPALRRLREHVDPAPSRRR